MKIYRLQDLNFKELLEPFLSNFCKYQEETELIYSVLYSVSMGISSFTTQAAFD